MTYRVIQWATGNVGEHALRAVIGHPDLELVGVRVYTDAKAGRDAGELVGLDPVGVSATTDEEALLASGADCVVYNASSELRPGEVVDDVCRILASGMNVVSSSHVPLVYPSAIGDGSDERLGAACREGGSSVYTSGIDPGFANDHLPLALSSLCERVDSVRILEIVNYATYNQPTTMFDIMGFGKERPEEALLLLPGSLSIGWGSTVAMMAAGLGVELDEITQSHEFLRAEETFEIDAGTIEKGTMAALRFEVVGVVAGRPAIAVEHVTRLRDDQAPDWPQGSGYRVVIEGEPSITCDLSMGSARGDHNTAALIATAMRVVNAIPHVCAAPPGVLTALDLPLYTATQLVSA